MMFQSGVGGSETPMSFLAFVLYHNIRYIKNIQIKEKHSIKYPSNSSLTYYLLFFPSSSINHSKDGKFRISFIFVIFDDLMTMNFIINLLVFML